jgi:hypothetical protein
MDYYYTSFTPSVLSLKIFTKGALDAVSHIYERNNFISPRDRLLVCTFLLIDNEIRDLGYFITRKAAHESDCYYFQFFTSSYFDTAIKYTNESLDNLYFLARFLCNINPRSNTIPVTNCKRLARQFDAAYSLLHLEQSVFTDIENEKREFWIRFFQSIRDSVQTTCLEKLNDCSALITCQFCTEQRNKLPSNSSSNNISEQANIIPSTSSFHKHVTNVSNNVTNVSNNIDNDAHMCSSSEQTDNVPSTSSIHNRITNVCAMKLNDFSAPHSV